MPHTSRGFTLVEVMVALAIGALVLLSARAILERLADTADRTTETAILTDRVANTDRIAHLLFARTVAADDSNVFDGGPYSVRLSSWCDVPGGWTEPCVVNVGIISTTKRDSALRSMSPLVPSGPVNIVIQTSAGDALIFREALPHAEFRYLESVAHPGRWMTGWSDGMHTPVAVGIVTGRDTLVFRIGERR